MNRRVIRRRAVRAEHVRAARPGAALLEVIVALTILVTAGAAAVATTVEATTVVRRAASAEFRTRDASAFLTAVALWPRAELDRRLGEHAQGPWRLMIERPARTLYIVTLADSAGGSPLLRTALFRADTSNGPQ